MKRLILTLAALYIAGTAYGQGFDLDDALAYWSCDDGDGASETSFNLTVNGSVTSTATAIAGNACSMPTDSDFLEWPIDGGLDLSNHGQWTAQVWARTDDPTFARIMGVFNQQLPERPWSIDLDGDDVIEGRIDGPAVIVNSGVTMSADTYYHLVLNYDGTDLCLIVNDGTPVCEESDPPPDVSNARFRLGNGVDGSGGNTPGMTHVDEAGIWVGSQSWGDVPSIVSCMYNEGSGRSASTKSDCNPFDAFTFGVQIYKTSTNDNVAILGIGALGVAANYQYMLRSHSGGDDFYQWCISDGSNNNCASTPQADLNQWVCMVAWYDAPTGEVGLYYGPTDDVYTTTSSSIHDVDEPFRIGLDANDNNGFEGLMDHIGVWHRKLNEAEIDYYCSGEFTP
jgi:hypothetical protein